MIWPSRRGWQRDTSVTARAALRRSTVVCCGASPILGTAPVPGDGSSRYRIVGPLGRGGMGEVCLAHDSHLDRRVALKLLPGDQTGDEKAVRGLLKEARSSAALDHPFICKTYETGQIEGDVPFIAMEYVEGSTLRSRPRAGQTVDDRSGAHRGGNRRRARLRAPPRHRPPRSQAGQRHADAGRARQAARLRHRASAERRCRQASWTRRTRRLLKKDISAARSPTCRRSRSKANLPTRSRMSSRWA